jgi:hypothetical protein
MAQALAREMDYDANARPTAPALAAKENRMKP